MSDELKKQLLAQKLFRNLKSKQKSSRNPQDEEASSSINSKIAAKAGGTTSKGNEIDLTKRAIEEIQRETERAAKLADEVGPSGWRMKSTRTNKRFLANTMRSVLCHNERTKVKHEKESRRKFDALTKRPPKFGARLHSFQSTDERTTKQNQPDDTKQNHL